MHDKLDILYDQISELREDGRILKLLHLGFSVFYEGSESDTIRLHKENTVETVVLIQRK